MTPMTLTPILVDDPGSDGYQIHQWSEHGAPGPDFDLTVTVATAIHPVTDHVDGPVVILDQPVNVDEIRDRAQLDALITALVDARTVWDRLNGLTT